MAGSCAVTNSDEKLPLFNSNFDAYGAISTFQTSKHSAQNVFTNTNNNCSIPSAKDITEVNSTKYGYDKNFSNDVSILNGYKPRTLSNVSESGTSEDNEISNHSSSSWEISSICDSSTNKVSSY